MKIYKHLTSKEKEEIIKLHFEKKISQSSLAKQFGTNRTTISVICRNNGESPLRKDYRLDTDKIVHLYTKEKKSVLQIATILGISTRPITRRLRLAQITKKVSQRNKWEKEIPHYFLKLKIWAFKVIERDDMKCKRCGNENTFENRLEAHHITPVRDIESPDQLFETNNGICLCRKCHMDIHYHEKEHEIFFRNLI